MRTGSRFGSGADMADMADMIPPYAKAGHRTAAGERRGEGGNTCAMSAPVRPSGLLEDHSLPDGTSRDRPDKHDT